MGTFGGHILPGAIFTIAGIWWTIQIFRRFYQSKARREQQFYSSVTFTSSRLPFDVEAACITIAALIGITGEVATAYENGVFTHMVNAQHATMYAAFAVGGITVLLCQRLGHLPNDIQYVAMTMAFCVEGVQFLYHLHGRDAFDVRVHMLLLYVTCACAVASLVEMSRRQDVMAALIRAYCVLLQGTWCTQIGFVLYNPLPEAVQWDGKNEGQMMVIVMIFAWHLIGVFVTVLTLGWAVSWGCNRGCDLATSNGHKIAISQDSESVVKLQSDQSDSENECHKLLSEN